MLIANMNHKKLSVTSWMGDKGNIQKH